MGNQESVSNGTYIIKKKIDSKKKDLNIKQKDVNKDINKDINKDKREIPKYKECSGKLINEKKIDIEISNDKLIDKEIYNNKLIDRNMLSELYNKNNVNRIIDYPTNSNRELTIPKVNIDNVQFTPYNFNEEVDTFKKNIDVERINFQNEEQERRNIFELSQKNKEDYLKKQIKKFESIYNPWEILELKYEDYNIQNIKKAYKKKALKYHPDKSGDNDKFQLITQAYIYLLGKAEDNEKLLKKTSVAVENIDYEDDVNENRENIYIDKDKFDINKFNKIFEDYKIPTSFDKGYGDLMKGEVEDNQVFGQKFNNDIFNAHFDKIKKNMDLVEYREPDALDSGNLGHTFLGINDIEDFGCMNSGSLLYTDIKKAHVDERLLIDVNKVKYKTYNSIDQLESDRSKLSYEASIEDKKRNEYLERKRAEDENFRIQQQKDYDHMIKKQYNKLNRKLIINK